MDYDATLCFNPANHRQIYRKKNGTFKTAKYNRAVNRFNRCIADKLSSPAEVANEIGSYVEDITNAIVGGGGQRPAYVPEYSQGGGASGGEEFFQKQIGGVPIVLILGSAVALMLWSK